MDVLKRIKSSTILENLIASVILMTLFIIAGNSLNNTFKSSITSRDLYFDNEVKKTEYLIIHKKLELPRSIETSTGVATFKNEEGSIQVELQKRNSVAIKTICCTE